MSSTTPGSLRRHARNIVMRIVAAQLAVGLVIVAGLFLLDGKEKAYAALAGTLIGVLPSYYLGNRIFGVSGGASGDVMLKQIYVAEMMKLGFTVALFLITIVVLDADFFVVVCTYAVVAAVNWVAMRVCNLGVTTGESNEAS